MSSRRNETLSDFELVNKMMWHAKNLLNATVDINEIFFANRSKFSEPISDDEKIGTLNILIDSTDFASMENLAIILHNRITEANNRNY